MARINMECYIRAESWSSANVRKNAPISPGLPYEPTVCIIDEIKITEVHQVVRFRTPLSSSAARHKCRQM